MNQFEQISPIVNIHSQQDRDMRFSLGVGFQRNCCATVKAFMEKKIQGTKLWKFIPDNSIPIFIHIRKRKTEIPKDSEFRIASIYFPELIPGSD